MTTREVFYRFVEDLWKQGVRTLEGLLNAQGTGDFSIAPTAINPLPPEITEALSSGKRLFSEYVDAAGEKTTQWVTPQQIIGAGDTLSLDAYCHLRDATRLFRLDRIVKMEIENP